jgi:hypothetical protein
MNVKNKNHEKHEIKIEVANSENKKSVVVADVFDISIQHWKYMIAVDVQLICNYDVIVLVDDVQIFTQLNKSFNLI